MRIRIVRRVDARIRDGQLRLLLAQGILDRRIDLERHADGKALQHDGGDRHLILRETRLALYHRGDREKIMQCHVLRLRPLSDVRRQHFIGMTIHEIQDLARRVLLGDAVRICKEKSFCLDRYRNGAVLVFQGAIGRRFYLKVCCPFDARFRKEASDLMHRRAFRYRDQVCLRLPML